jgi:hypothetical protein
LYINKQCTVEIFVLFLFSCHRQFLFAHKFWIGLRYNTGVHKEPRLPVVGLVPADHFRFPVVRLAHVREESAALRELFAAILAEGAVVPPDSLVNGP